MSDLTAQIRKVTGCTLGSLTPSGIEVRGSLDAAFKVGLGVSCHAREILDLHSGKNPESLLAFARNVCCLML